MGRRHVAAPPGTTTLNTVTPCAACKLLRRRCAAECPFSPYFSPHEPHKFAAVHKVFGASNVSKLLTEVPESQRGDAANSLVYEANLRLRDPVYGCMGAISALQHQIQSLQAEISAVRSDILRYRYREAAAAAAAAASAVSPNALISHTTAAASPATLLSVVASAPPPQPTPAQPWTPPPSLPSPSAVVSSSSSNSNSSPTTTIYNPPPSSAATGYRNSNMSSDNNIVHYFD